jgi:hypothetical protein
MTRGVLYIVWGDKVEAQLERSMQSVKKYYPDMAIHVERVENLAERSLLQKAKMAALTRFESTVYLDSDTVVLGNLDFAFERAEEFGLACSICECPWTRRYDAGEGDNIEYSTGVIFFSAKSRRVFELWEKLAPSAPATSRWWAAREGRLFSNAGDDQASFARAIRSANFNPFVLPVNYNFRPNFFQSVFCPIKIWHASVPVPGGLEEMSGDVESGKNPVTYVNLKWQSDKP